MTTTPKAMAPKALDKAVGANIRAAREREAVTQAELVARLGALGWKIDPPAMSGIENGRRSVRVSQLALLAQALDVEPNALLAVRHGADELITDVNQAWNVLIRAHLGLDMARRRARAVLFGGALSPMEDRKLRAAVESYTSETAEDVAAEALAESSRFDAPETGADLGEHVETIEVLPLESEMPGPREASGQGIGDVIETREYEPMPDAPGPVERSAKERARARW